MSLKRALLILVGTVLAAAVVPAGLLLQRQVEVALLDRARSDLASAPMVLKDRFASIKDVRMMHARDFAHAPGLAEAMAGGDLDAARRIVLDAARAMPEEPVLVAGDRTTHTGPGDIPDPLLEATRRGEMPVAVVPLGSTLHLVALAPVQVDGTWMGAAGGATRIDEGEAGTLAGLTRSDVIIFRQDGTLVASSVSPEDGGGRAGALASTLATMPPADSVRELSVGGAEYLVVTAPYDVSATAAFVREKARELALLPDLRRTAGLSTVLVLLFAVAVGVFFAGVVARPVGALADAADRFAAGDVDAPLPSSALTDVQRVADAFGAMRETLAARLEELESANEELADRQERLSHLQAELLQRERLAATGRLLTQLAHEIRNPIASVRNCLEVVRRKGRLEDEARDFVDMAVDELLRMHEMAERMLDLHRPRDQEGESCDVAAVARDVTLLVRAGHDGPGGRVSVIGPESVRAGIPADTLKQVLLNLVLNAGEVTDGEGPVEIVVTPHDEGVRVEVLDRGPGIPDEALARLFDPFFTTKEDVHGVGLGLFTAEGLIRTHGGRIGASNRNDGPGARFVVDLPPPDPGGGSTDGGPEADDRAAEAGTPAPPTSEV